MRTPRPQSKSRSPGPRAHQGRRPGALGIGQRTTTAEDDRLHRVASWIVDAAHPRGRGHGRLSACRCYHAARARRRGGALVSKWSEDDVRALLGELGQHGFGGINPDEEQLRSLLRSGEDGPLQFVNLLSYRARAAYPDGHELASRRSHRRRGLRPLRGGGAGPRRAARGRAHALQRRGPGPDRPHRALGPDRRHAVSRDRRLHRHDPGPGLSGAAWSTATPAWPRRPSSSPAPCSDLVTHPGCGHEPDAHDPTCSGAPERPGDHGAPVERAPSFNCTCRGNGGRIQ